MNKSEKNTLYAVVPCYNEEEVLAETTARLVAKFDSLVREGKISDKSRIAYVNDGSKDKTWEIISQYAKEKPYVVGVNLSRNKGHQNAVLAGIITVKEKADMIISLDADLQDDINAIDEMVDKYHEGYEVVYGVRSERKTDSAFKRVTAQGFYKFIKLMGVDIVYNHADYRLLSKRAADELENFSEVNLFLRGIIPQIGFKSTNVYYERAERFAGESKYPLKKMLSFAFDGITSFSVRPVKMITTLGFFMLVVSFGMLIYGLVSFFLGVASSGWTSLLVSLWAIGGVQMIALGVIGEYIGKVYMETKRRPRFIVDDFLEKENDR